MTKPHITIHDIARELNVSASTVSRALQNHPRISQSTREAVQKLAAKYDYQPNVVASSLRRGTSRTVGVIVPRINRNFFSNVIGGMEETLAVAGYQLMICQTYESFTNELKAIHTLINARVDAIILSISMETIGAAHLKTILDRGIRLFFFDRVLEELAAGSVVIDDKLGAFQSVKHLLDQGYSRIYHISGAEHIPIYRNRKEGYLTAMAEAGIEVPPEWILERPLVLDGGIAAFQQAIKAKEPPDAFFCAGDFAALGVLQAALKYGIKVPEDLGVCGFANEPFTAFLTPSMSTVDQRGEEMGRIVAGMFLRCSNSEPGTAPCERVILKPGLIIRDSSSRSTADSFHKHQQTDI